jgi:hypothetical protein
MLMADKEAILSIYLTLLIPLSFKGEGEEEKRGASAPLRRPVNLVSFRRRV